MSGTPRIVVPAQLAACHARFDGDAGRAWVAALPGLAATSLDRWDLRLDGPVRHGAVALVLPVRRPDGTPAVLKLSPPDEETAGEPAALRAWGGRGAVRLLDEDPATGTMLLERLDPDQSLRSVPDHLAALEILSGLLARLVATPAPPGIRHLRDIAGQMVARAPTAVAALADPDQRRLLQHCAGAGADVLPETGDRLLHWDLHYENVLGAQRETWLAIDPKPLAGDPGFELFPALWNRWDEVTSTGDVTRAVRRRFDLMVDIAGLDRDRAVSWTLVRVLQETLWEVGDGATRMRPAVAAIGHALRTR